MIVTLVVVVVALLVGLLANYFLRDRLLGEGAEGMSVKDLIGPMQTLTILVLAFTLVTASTSHGKADEAARTEAGAVDYMFEVADFSPAAHRQRLQADTVCYARAVRSQEWSAMADGNSSSA